MQKLPIRNIKQLVCVSVPVLLTACVGLSRDRGVTTVDRLVAARSVSDNEAIKFSLRPIDDTTQKRMTALLSEPLDADAAVRVALLGNAGMQALYARLGMTQAEVYDATRLANPSVGFMQLGGDGARTTWSLTQQFTKALFVGYHTQQGKSALLQTQLSVAQSVLNLESEVRRAYYRYVTAALVAQLHEQDSLAAQAAALYAQELYRAGSVSELQVNRERAAASDAKLAWQQALNEQAQRRSELLTLLGIAAPQAAQFVERLDVPVKQSLQADALLSWAEQQRLDLQVLREQVNSRTQQRTHVRRWFWLDDVGLDVERETDSGVTRNGVGGSVGLPLFNQGSGTRLRAQAAVEQSQAELKQLQLSIRNDLAAQLQIVERSRQAVEEYRDTLVPLHEKVLELTQQQQNYMLIGAFELLNAKRELLNTYQSFLRTTGDYWLNQVTLQQLVGGKLPESAGDASYGISVGVDALPETQPTPSTTSEAGSSHHAQSPAGHQP